MEEVERGKKKEEEEASFRLFLSGSVSRLFSRYCLLQGSRIEVLKLIVLLSLFYSKAIVQ